MNVHPQLIGYPRIGPRRELKWLLEGAWSGKIGPVELDGRTQTLRAAHLAEQRELIGSAVDDFFLYDQVLETAMMFGLVPESVDRDADAFGALTGLARGTPDREAWEMTKWFDTNYHYVVPQVDSAPAGFRPLPWREPTHDEDVTWAMLGPYSLVKLSKLGERVDPRWLAASLGRALWVWAGDSRDLRLQLDEPCLGLLMDGDDRVLLEAAYADAGHLRSTPLVTVQFGRPSKDTLRFLGKRGFTVQVPLELATELAGTRAWAAQPEHVVSVMDGRSVWQDDFEPVGEALALLAREPAPVRIVPSTSLMFLPYTTEGERLPEGVRFAREKARELRAWAEALAGGPPPAAAVLKPVEWPKPGKLVSRAPRGERRAAQADLDLPPFPTTTIGSLPQTGEVRGLRARLGRKEISRGEYESRIDELTREAVAWQEARGLDVLIHGEFERTDMVEFFAARMKGFHVTRNGWVLSYGSRCVRPPILEAPPTISEPVTVREWKVAQAASRKPVKAMLTGPVTIVNWSFRPRGVSDDRLFWAVARPIAEEVGHLVEAGARVIQIDEPAVRERWPLPAADARERREVYARGVRAALNHVFAAPPAIQMHTHMCYGDFGDIVPLWAEAGVDVASIEYSRSKDESYIRLFYELFADGHLQIGPGVFDVHSPHSPGSAIMRERLQHFLGFMDPGDVWVNPDCGLKTRRWEEIEVQIADMVAAARALRKSAKRTAGAAGTD